MHQGETICEQVTEMLKPVKELTNLVLYKDYKRITPVYRCTATEEEEAQCTGFLAGQDGKCCYAVITFGLKTCGKD